MNKQQHIEEFNNVLENDALLDVFTTAGVIEKINQDSFEISSSKELTILILASGLGGETIGELLSSMVAEHTLKTLEEYQYEQKSSQEIILFLESVFFNANELVIDYLVTANIQGPASTLSIVIIYKNSLYTAHIGEGKIYLIDRDNSTILLSKNHSEQENNVLGDESYDKQKLIVTHQENLRHKEKLILCNKHSLESIPENKFNKKSEDIKKIIQETPPLLNSTFLRYTHYERSVETIKISQEEIYSNTEESEIEWERVMPILKKIALACAIFFILGFFYLILENFFNEPTIQPLVQKNYLDKNSSKKEQVKGEQEEVAEEQIQILHPLQEIQIEKKEKRDKKLKLLQKKESTVLVLGEKGIRITFKNNRLVASKAGTCQVNPNRKHEIYCELKGIDSHLKGNITKELKKQLFSQKVSITSQYNKTKINIKVKKHCQYTQSNWAKNNGLDLFIFNCKEEF